MKTIEQAAKIIYNDAKSIGAFINGAEFAESWIKVEDELPEKVSLDVSELVLTEDDKGVMMLERYDHDQKMFLGINYSSLEVRRVVKWRPINRI